tara:strand:- start:137 stop:598 length:462 start_codon:yes stop_codon:yes gene_type:complete
MKKILLYLCFLIFFGCSGYEPIFSKKDLNFYISDIENINNNKTTIQIIRNIRSFKLNDNSKKNYFLKINSKENEEVTSRDSKGDPLTYRITINTKVIVFRDGSNVLYNTINITKDFSYNYQVNQFELGQYKKDIVENLIVKISEEILLELQLM